jgi:hypothetical protein
MLEEVGVPYEYHRVSTRDPTQRAAYLEVNPAVNVASVVNLATAMGSGKLGERSAPWFAAAKARPAWQKVAANG